MAAIMLTAFVLVAFAWPARHEDQAVGAAVEAVDGTTPNVGTWGSCDYGPGLSNAILRPRYTCVVRSCRRVIGRIEVTHDLLGGWTYEIEAGRAGAARTGDAEPNETTTVTELDPAEWRRGGNCRRGG